MKQFHPSDWRALEACCRPWTWWCNDATALAGYATTMMMMMISSVCFCDDWFLQLGSYPHPGLDFLAIFSGFAPSWAESPRKNLFVSDNDISCINSMFLCRISVRSCLTMISWLVRTRRRLCNMRSALLTSILEFHACLMQKVCDASNSLYYLITNCFSLNTDIRSQKSVPWKTSGWRSKRRQ